MSHTSDVTRVAMALYMRVWRGKPWLTAPVDIKEHYRKMAETAINALRQVDA